MQPDAGKISFVQKLAFFIPALLACVALTAAIVRLDFEGGSPLAFVLPVIPVAFLFTYWLPARCTFPAMIIAGTIACYLFLGPYNTGAVLLILSAFALLFYIFKRTAWRVAAAVMMVAALAVLRLGKLHLPVIPLAVPVAATMIMFRFVLMVYEHHYKTVQTTFAQKLAYLFLLPALAFPLYPIVDYKNFVNNHDPANTRTIRTGLTRITAGLLFMMLYRVMYLYVIPSYVEVHDAGSALVYMTGSYLYVFNIVGVLWIGVGYLGVLGFALPPVFNYIFLVDSFRDIWRRINTYWRDFVVKLVYYPLYFKLRRKTKYVIIITSLITLSVSALLHGWQWFWLQGTIDVHSTGVIFWCVIGLVISINLSMQPKTENGLPAAPKKNSKLIRALRITGMLAFMSFMWSLWNSGSISEWKYFLHFFGEGNAVQWAWIISGTGLVFLTMLIVVNLQQKPAGYHIFDQPIHTVVALAVGALLVLPTFSFVADRLQGNTGKFIASISTARMNSADQGDATENYYNRMLASDGTGMRPWEMHTPGANARSGLDEACTRRNDILVRELIPNKVTVLDGWSIATNQWGMRDKEYTKKKPEGVFRIAVLGASYEMGSGVPQDSVFEALAENMLRDSVPGRKIEILNFSVGGYHLPQQVWVAQHKIGDFEPDLVLCCVHPSDATRNSNYMCKLIKNVTDLVYPELYAIKKESGAEQSMSENELKNRLYPFSHRIAQWSLSTIATTCDSLHADFAVVYIPALQETSDAEYYKGLLQPEHELAPPPFTTTSFFDLSEIFRNREKEYQLANDPSHPNGKAHYEIARALTRNLKIYFRMRSVPGY